MSKAPTPNSEQYKGRKSGVRRVCASGLSLVVELLNSALEAAVDHTSLEIHPLAKRAKDAGSAAQYTCLTFIAILWGMAVYACLTA